MNDARCSAIDLGIECTYRAVMLEPVPLCAEHRIQVAALAIPEILADALRMSQAGTIVRRAPEDEAHALTVGAIPVGPRLHLGSVHSPLVYFIVAGDRVKIGTSTNLRQRMRSLSAHEPDIALTLRGGVMLERALHERFALYRIAGTEWFTLEDPIASYVEEKHEQLHAMAKAAREREQAEQWLLEDAERQSIAALAARMAERTAARIAEAAAAQLEEEVAAAAPPRPVFSYPGGTEIEERDVRLWQLLGEFGAEGATAKQLAARAESRGHQYSSPAWIRGRLEFWREQSHVRFETEGRETRHWRTDLRADQRRDA